MTVGQIIFDALAWCRYFAVNTSVGRPEVKLIWYEAFQYAYNHAVVSHPEFFFKSAAISGASWTIPADFRRELVLVVDDAGCSAGFAKVIPNEEWDTRQSNSRTAASVSDPQALKGTSAFTMTPTITAGKAYYIRNYAEPDLINEATDIATLLPLVYQPLLLSKMQELIRIRHYKIPETPTEREKHMMVMKSSSDRMKRSLKPLEIIEGVTERPQGIEGGG